MGFVKNLLRGANELVTLGGMSRLEAAQLKYQRLHEEYSVVVLESAACKSQIDSQVEEIGRFIIRAKSVLDRVERILRTHVGSTAGLEYAASENIIIKVEKFNSDFSSVAAVGAGGAAGGALAVGSWALVTLLGSASTGTAISTLSGVAATNATLAWFGGGALAAGGAGMTGGMAVLGGVVAIPLVYIAASSTHKKAKKLEEAAVELEEQIPIARASVSMQQASLARSGEMLRQVDLICEEFMSFALSLIKVVRPYGVFSLAKQRILALFRASPLNARQVEAIAELEAAANKFLTALRNGLGSAV